MPVAGYSLGTAWVQISPSMKGFRSSVERELGGINTRPAERSITSGLGGALSSVGKAAALAGTAIGAIGVGAGLASVAQQAVNAADATLKFKNTLSFAGVATDQIEALTASTKEYADKTVYGLDDIQNITAQLAANGVEGYDQLAQAAGNLNAVAGGNAETFKSVGMVMTQTAGQGKLTTENWNQLSDAIPGASGKIQQALLDAGAYTGNFRDAMAKGEITAEEFNQAIMDLGMTDVAQEAATSTQTMEGAWGNFEASMVTGAQQIAEKALPFITGALSTMSDWATHAFDWVSNSLIPSMSNLGNILFKGDFTGEIFGLGEDSTAVDYLFRVREAAQTVGSWVTTTLVPSLQSVYDILVNGDFSGPIFGLEEDSSLVSFLFNVRDTAISLWNTLSQFVTGTWQTIQTDVIPGTKSFLEAVTTSSAWQTITSFLSSLLGSQTVLTGVVTAFVAWKTAMAAWSIGTFIAGIAQSTVQLGANTVAWVTNKAAMVASKAESVALMAMYAKDFVVNLVKTGAQLAVNTAAWLAQNAAMLVVRGATLAYTGAQWLLNAALNANPISIIILALVALGVAIVAAWNNSETFRAIVTAAWEGIKAAAMVVAEWFLTTAWPWIQTAWDGISAGASWLWGIIRTVWDGIWAAVSAVVTWLTGTAGPYIQAAWTIISAGAQVLWTVISTVWNGIWTTISTVVSWIVSTVGPYIQAAWDNLTAAAQLLWTGIQLAWNGIWSAISAVVTWISTNVVPVVQAAWDMISTGATTLWSWITTAWNGIWSAISAVVTWLTGTAWPLIQTVWTGIQTGVTTLWTWITTAWNGIWTAISVVANWLYNVAWTTIQTVWTGIQTGANTLWNGISTIWNGIKTTIDTVRTWLVNTLQSAVTGVWTKIKEGAEKMRDGIGRAFDQVKSKAAKPINFVITTVYTNGIKSLVDKIMEKLGLDLRMPSVSRIAEYASGGVLPGYTPGRDVYHFTSTDGGGRLALSGGEAIMRPEWVRAVGGRRAVNAMNAAAAGRRPIPGGDSGMIEQAFAPGGIWDAIKDTGRSVAGGVSAAANWIKDTASAITDIVTDPAGAIENLVRTPINALLDGHDDKGAFWDAGKAIPKKAIDGVAEWLKSHVSQVAAAGPDGTAVAGDLVAQARLAIGTPYVWGGVNVPGGVDCSGLIVWALRKLGYNVPRHTASTFQANSTPGSPNAPGTLLFWGGSVGAGGAHHVAIASGGGRMIEAPTFGIPVREIGIYGGPSAGVFRYDEGGWLQPGTGMVTNQTRQPEAVMTGSQWDKIDRLVKALEDGALGPKVLEVRDVDNTLIGRMRVEAEDTVITYDRLNY